MKISDLEFHDLLGAATMAIHAGLGVGDLAINHHVDLVTYGGSAAVVMGAIKGAGWLKSHAETLGATPAPVAVPGDTPNA